MSKHYSCFCCVESESIDRSSFNSKYFITAVGNRWNEEAILRSDDGRDKLYLATKKIPPNSPEKVRRNVLAHFRTF